MKQEKKKHLCISIILILSLVFTSIPAMAFAAESESIVETEQAQGAAKELDDVTEEDVIEEESSEYVTAFDLGGGQKAKVISGYPVRYEDENGQMKEVDPSLSPVTDTKTTGQGVSLTGYAYENEAGEFKQYLPDAMSENSPVRMEYGDYAITMTPTGYLNGLLNRNKKVQCNEEEFTDLYGAVKKKKVKAVYESIDDSAFLEYTSLHDGLKESIILNEKPKKNEFSYKLTLTGLTAEVKEDGSIVFCDKKSGEIVASMEAPFMNDASGEAYSEDITCKLKQRGNSDQYTLTLTVDESYLADENRQYPVAIDPTATWVGTAKIHDAYIISSSPNYNYYQSDTRIMPSGRGSGGSKYRTCINVIGVRSELLDCNITSAYFDIYETANGNTNKAVRIYKILEDWVPSEVTWNTCPDFGTAASYLDENFSTGTANKKMRFDVTSWVEGIAAGGSNRGIMLKNKTETSTTYTEFYGSRTSATSYRPKLTVTYTEDKPTTATSVTASKAGYNVGESISVSWEGITANNLDHIEYRVAKYDADGTLLDDYYVPYTRLTSAKSSGTAAIPNSSSFPQGRYGVYIRGVSASGVNGTGKRSPIVTISKDKPTTPTSVSFSPNPCPEGHKVTASWSGLTAGELKSIQYRVASYDDEWNQVKYAYVPYTTLSVSPTSSGSVVLPDSDTWETGNYKVFIRGVSAAGVTGTGKGSSVVIAENGEPTIDTLSISVGGTSAGSGYVKPGNVTVTADKICDEDVITASNLSYSLYGPNDSQIGVSLSSSTVYSNSDGSYRVSFSIPQSAVSASGMYTLYFWVYDKAGNLGYISKSFNIDAAAPTGSINVTAVPYGNETTEITSLAKITASVNDAHSGVASSTLAIYKGTKDNPGEKVKDLYTNSSIKKIVDFDAEAYDNGSYCLKLTIEDKVGNTETVWNNITIAKPMEKPIVGVKINSGSGELSVSWGFQQEKQDLSYIQYNLDDSSDWIDVNITDKLKGTFTVALEEQMTGTHSIKVRGVDDTGAPGEAARVDFNVDTIAPTVQILDISQGIVLGSIMDDNLASWTISIKAKEDETAEFVETASGTKTVSNGRIALSGLSDEQFSAGVWYTVKVEARDHAGNVSSDTFDILKSEAETYAQMIPTEHRILRSLGQSMQENHFLVSRTEDRLQMEDSNLFTSAAWFVDGEPVSEEKDYETDFSAFEEGKRYGIAAAGKDAAGALYYTGDIYVGGTVLHPDLVQTETGDWEAAIPLIEQTVGFILEEGSVPEGTIWYAKTETGEYQQITPGELTYFLNINNHSLAPSLTTIKAVAPDGQVIEDTAFTLQLAVMDLETFSVSAAEDYYPENVSAQDKINYKTYVRWELPDTIPEGLSYEIHRSTIENFIPGDATLAAENVTDSYWCDINTNYSISLYYKVRAVIKDESGQVISASSYSATAESTPIDKNEYQKALGHKEYWAYADIATPSGSGYIEKSQGNFVYEQTDGEVANEQLEVALTRTYNSMATSKSAFGYGWTHSYDIELLKLGKDSSLEEGILVLRDGSGTLYQFKEDGNTYISSLGKHVTLTKENKTQAIALSDPAAPNTVETITVHTAYTMKTRDNMVYYFDDSGKLVWMEESNGNLLLFHYDEKRGLLDKITTGNNISVTFTYNDAAGGNDALTIHDMTLPDGQKVVYHYNNSLLTGVTKYPAGEASGGITYSYGYAGRKMTSLTDGKANTYSISYTGTEGKANQFTYPSSGGAAEGIRVSQQDGCTLTEKLVGQTVVKQEKDYFDALGQCIEHIDSTGNEEKTTFYEYKDSLLIKETERVSYNTLNGDTNGGSVVTSQYDRVKTYTYDEAEEYLTQEYDEDRAVAEFLYERDGQWDYYQPSQYTETLEDGTTTAKEIYTYDDAGNLARVVDQINGTFTNYSYFTGASDSAKGALKSEEERLSSDGTVISSTNIEIEPVSGGGKKETTTTLADGNKTVTETVYDVMGRELSTVTLVYTAFGTEKESINKESSTYSYDGFGRVTGTTTTTCKVDSALNEIESTVHTTTESKSYDANGTLIQETDADGITTTYTYDSMNRVLSQTRSGGGLSQTANTTYSYGNVSVNEGKEAETNYTNAFITTESIDGMTTGITYQDGMGRTVRQVSDSQVTDYSYDLSGQTLTEYTETDDTTGRLTVHVIDENGQETATLQNPVWDSASAAYTVGEDTICETAGYDLAGNLISQTDGKGNTTGYTYDALSRITKVTLPDDSQATYSYSQAGEDGAYREYVTQVTANGARSTETANAEGNIISTADYGASSDNPAAIETTASYDAFGNIIEEQRANGSKTLYTYDAKNRVTEKRQYNAAGAEKYRTVYTYYGNDLVKEMYDYKVTGTSQSLYHYVYNTYDGLKRLTSQAEVSGSSVPSDLSPYTVTYTYDLKDRLSAVSYGSASGSEVDGMIYHYSGNMLTDVSVKIGSNTYLAKAYTYNTDGSVQTVKDYYNFRNGDTANYLLLSYSYDAFGRVTDLQYSKAGEKVEQHSYAYDKNSNITRESNFNTFSELDEIRVYTYDNLNQLKTSVFKNIITETVTVEGEADEEGNPTTITQTVTREEEALTTSYAYDIVGNRLQKVENGAATNYTYNSLNQLTSEKGTGTNLTYRYDENGNQTGITGTSGGSNVNKTFTYTPEDMLETYTEGSASQINLYDGEGQRVQKKEGSDVTNYFYQEGSVLYTNDGNGNLKAFNLLNVSDIFGTTRKSGTAEDYYLYTEDLKGSTVNVLDSSAGSVASYWYNDFGEAEETKASGYSSFENELQYTGAVYDDSTGLLYLNARFYDPQTGRFISRDTYRGEQDDAGTWHLYLYCANNPVNYVDPSGHYYTAVRLGYNLYRVSRAAAVAGTIISSGGTLLIVIAVSGVAWYAGSKMAKVTTKPATKKGKRVKSTAKKKKTKKSNKEKANDVPTWVKNYKQKPGENGKHFADRVCNDRYGRNNYKKGPGTEYNRIKKWGDRRG